MAAWLGIDGPGGGGEGWAGVGAVTGTGTGERADLTVERSSS